MITIPLISTVADLQRAYRKIMDTIKKTGEPMVIVNNGKPEGVLMDVDTYNAQMEKLNDLEVEYLLKMKDEAVKEYRLGKTVEMRKNETFADIIKRTNEN